MQFNKSVCEDLLDIVYFPVSTVGMFSWSVDPFHAFKIKKTTTKAFFTYFCLI